MTPTPRNHCHIALGMLAGLLLNACVSAPTPYQPQHEGQGYSEQRIEDNRYRVSFAGNTLTPRDEVENYMLLRAAELTLSNGYDYFILSGKDTETHTEYFESITSYGCCNSYFDWYWPRPVIGSRSAIPITDYEAFAYVSMFKGTKPDHNPNAFDAHQVSDSLQATARKPVPR